MKMNKYIDHTLLKADATYDKIKVLCEEAKEYDFASVCVNGYWVSACKELLAGSDVMVCTVIGFPLGAMSSDAKAFETRDAINHGANEVDMVLNIGEMKAGHYDAVLEDIKAVVEAAKVRGLSHDERHAKVEYVVAHGISTTIEGKKAVIGSQHFVFEDEKCVIPEGMQERFDAVPEEYSHLYLAVEGRLVAIICIEDPLRPEAVDVIRGLKKAGISKVVMMTGDSDRTARAVASKVGVDEYYSEVLPEDKASFVDKERSAGRKVIMIGDGINDSPALSAADVGIAISDGAEIAREIADVTISADNLEELVKLKQISNGLIKRIHQNYRVIVGFNMGLIILGVAGILQPTTSALFHNTSTLLISLKSMTDLLPEV